MKIDAPNADEFAFIYDSWSNSFRNSPWAGVVPNDMWPEVSRRSMQEIVDRPSTIVRVAAVELEDGSRRVAGYYVAEPERKILHWLYVKRDYRGMEIGRALLRDALFSHCDYLSPGGAVKMLEDYSTPIGKGWVYTHRTNASAGYLPKCIKWDAVPARVKAA